MDISLKPLDQQVMVITGASSGIGLATAIAAAQRGAKLVLAARSENTLNDIAQRINDEGGEVVAVAVGVANRAQVETVTRTAIERFGRIDTWVNDAGVSIFGKLWEADDEDDNRRLFDTNFWASSMVRWRRCRICGKAAAR